MNLKKNKSESGAALITVLCLILVMSLLAFSAVTYSQLSALIAYPAADSAASVQIAESVFARVAWIILADNQNLETNRNSELGGNYYEDKDSGSAETQFLPDGVPHIINFYSTPVQVRVVEMHSGLPATTFLDTLKKYYQDRDETSIAEMIDSMNNRVKDYTDDNDFTSEKGMEKDDYESRGLSPLPRNKAMQFREELLYIPSMTKLIKPDSMGRLNQIQLIPPSGMRLRNNVRPGLFTASNSLIAAAGSFEDEEAKEIIDGVNLWYKNRTPITDSIDDLLMQRVRRAFNLRDTGYYTIFITPLLNSFSSRTLVVSVQLTNQLPTDGLHYYEWSIY